MERFDRFGWWIALVIGALSALAFQPVGLWPLMPLALAILCELIARAGSLKRALFTGWLFGLGQFVVGLNWIATAFTFQAAMPAWLGWIAVVLLSLYLALYPALAAGLAWRFGMDRPLALVLALAGGWGIAEWLRSTIFTGFPWNPAGATLVDTPWRFLASYLGTYGLSLLVAAAGGALWLASRRKWRPALTIGVLLALLLTLPQPLVPECCLRVFDVAQAPAPAPARPAPPPPAPPPRQPSESPAPPPPPVTPHSAFRSGAVRIVQPNIGQNDKWRPGFDAIAANRLRALNHRGYTGGQTPADTVYWPEAAVTQPLLDDRPLGAPAAAFERSRAAATIVPGQLLATGGIALVSADRRRITDATNSVFVLDSAGSVVARYDKSHLVPFGEYLPMRPLLSALGLSRLAPGDVDFRAGPGPRTLALPNGLKMGVQICYEIIFSGRVVDPRSRPDYLFNPSNDAWFGAWGPPQHLAQARLRAAEEGLPIIRSTPTGVSAMIDAAGRLVATIPLGTASVIDSGLPLPAEPTLFSRFGNLIPLLIAFALLISAIALAAPGRYRRGT